MLVTVTIPPKLLILVRCSLIAWIVNREVVSALLVPIIQILLLTQVLLCSVLVLFLSLPRLWCLISAIILIYFLFSAVGALVSLILLIELLSLTNAHRGISSLILLIMLF